MNSYPFTPKAKLRRVLCERGECSHTDNKEDYRGLVAITRSGIVCQNWSATFPHIPRETCTSAETEKGLGLHNLCRNPDGENGPWCYTLDPGVRWEECDTPVTNSSCPLAETQHFLFILYFHTEEFRKNLNPVDAWTFECLLLKHDTKLELSVSVLSTNALTVAFYIYPYLNSMGDIVEIGNDEVLLRMEQTYTNGFLYQSEVTVFFNDQQLTRAHVLQPEVWTFLAFTFDGVHKNVKLWRNGEIASIGYIEFTQMQLASDETNIKIGGEGVKARVAALQVYDRVLDESEIKAARDRPYGNRFERIGSSVTNDIGGKVFRSGAALSYIHCANMCHMNIFCNVFGFRKHDKLCILFSHHHEAEGKYSATDMEYFQRSPLN
ncbi:uncharacterized protein [Antedon mediterranea]|uniref:uncharacterized protein n=1 Tax=Antedon mediterranea TaxID=105859 RepID=UPI003AF779FD